MENKGKTKNIKINQIKVICKTTYDTVLSTFNPNPKGIWTTSTFSYALKNKVELRF